MEAINIRKNQTQVDINGNKVGNNRPDIQYDIDENTLMWNLTPNRLMALNINKQF